MVYDVNDLRGTNGQSGAAGGGRGGTEGGSGGGSSGQNGGGTGLVFPGGSTGGGMASGGSSGAGRGGTPSTGGAEDGGEGGAIPVAGGTAGAAPGGSGAGGKVVVPATLIDDFEDRNHRVFNHQERNGFWYTFVIGDYEKLLPAPGMAFNMFEYESSRDAPPGLESAAAFQMVVASVTGPMMGIGAGIGVNFKEPKGAYDASNYSGISFWIRASKPLNPIDVQIVTRSTDNEGGVCTENVDCSNHFRMELQVGEEWQRETHLWESFKQDVGWGKQVAWNPEELFSVHFFVRAIDTDETDTEVYIDDISFVEPQ